LHRCVLTFPKLDKHSLGQALLAKSLQLIETIFLASRLTAAEKKEPLLQANSQLDLLKLLIRLSQELKAIDEKKYIVLEGFLQEAGKMLGGWIRSLD
jgi:hypothetical protein